MNEKLKRRKRRTRKIYDPGHGGRKTLQVGMSDPRKRRLKAGCSQGWLPHDH